MDALFGCGAERTVRRKHRGRCHPSPPLANLSHVVLLHFQANGARRSFSIRPFLLLQLALVERLNPCPLSCQQAGPRQRLQAMIETRAVVLVEPRPHAWLEGEALAIPLDALQCPPCRLRPTLGPP
eukprot:1810080-Prymnesium_polylepis.1